MDELTARRELDAHVWLLYKIEIRSWCGPALSIEIVAERTGLTQDQVRRIVARHDTGEFM